VPAHQRTAAGWRAAPPRFAAGRAGRWRRRAAPHRLPRRRRRRRVTRSRPIQCHPPCRPAPPGRGPGPARRPQKGRPPGTRHDRGPRRGAAAPYGGGRRPGGPEQGLTPGRQALIHPDRREQGLVPACGTCWARRNRARRAAGAQQPGPTAHRRHEPRTGARRRRPALPRRPGPSSPGGSRRGAVAAGKYRGEGRRNRPEHRQRGQSRWPACPRHSSPLLLHRLPPRLLAGSLPARCMISGRCAAPCPDDPGPCAADGRPSAVGGN
jgi:hypothetical protein